jgi:hypothetical protein
MVQLSEDRLETEPAGSGGSPGALFARLPRAVWIVALLAALLHMAPYWHAQMSARGDLTFTGNVTISPDQMQYRVWERQSQREGPLITNRFTTEPNRKYLPVVFHWLIGKTAAASGASPESVYAYSGAFFAILLALLVFAAVRHFVPGTAATWWAYLAIMFGGGLGAHLSILTGIPPLLRISSFNKLVTEPLQRAPVFEQSRANMVVLTLFDTQALLTWVLAMASVLALYTAVRRPTVLRALGVALLFALITVLHIYEGLTLVAIAVGVLLCARAAERRSALTMLVVGGGAVSACYLVLGVLFRRSGLPFPSWRGFDVLVSILFLAFPLYWVLIAWGGATYWARAGARERFVIGWALGCLALTLSGPFYPYPQRGTLTLQVALAIIAVSIYFARWPRVSRGHALLAVAVLGAAPVWIFHQKWTSTGDRPNAPFQYQNPSHRRILGALLNHSDTNDVLLAEPQDLLWLAPEFPGRLYVGHFFLTVRYDDKLAELRDALDVPARLPALLSRSGATLVYVNAPRRPERFADLPGLTPVIRESEGWLFTTRPPIRSGP